eukprot:CAMPEP_0195093020 /NCGR_PEP_ID=MMETSP0448-20130528/39732_1 /TAXON_ID=66468 /ORGANISM="Heterocapsa triquestra, Strain CCMP 448" /LENGTH=47 /DNA_ID= /DNA_START= /DNA_END= /DNA_ORIENTATION=
MSSDTQPSKRLKVGGDTGVLTPVARAMTQAPKMLMFHIGTNNWQRQG